VADFTTLNTKVNSLSTASGQVLDPWMHHVQRNLGDASTAPLSDQVGGVHVIPHDVNAASAGDMAVRLNTLEHALKAFGKTNHR
jgi:hypothetical protein